MAASSDSGLQLGMQMLFTVGPDQHVNGTIMYIGPLHEDASCAPDIAHAYCL